MDNIKLNDILRIEDLNNVKIRFNLMFQENWNPIELFKNGDITKMLDGHYWNYKRSKSYKEGQITIGLVKIKQSEDLWLLFHIWRVTKDLDVLNDVGYKYEDLPEYKKYIWRLIVRFKNNSQTLIRKAEKVIENCYVSEILPDIFSNDVFPGYEKVNISWSDMKRVLEKDNWKTALQNQKGIYLLTDTSNGKMYVGSAYGKDMILWRWKGYLNTGHWWNVELKKLTFDHIKQYFRFSILDIYKSTTEDQIIINRESWWKEVLQCRRFGYNQN